jgi:tRNA (mo5U34)-methyltransferase
MVTMDDAAIEEAARANPAWRHRIALTGAFTTPGTEDTQTEWRRLQIPESLTGRRVLDVGCSDGFYSFECERRGAEVVAIDDESSLMTNTYNGFQIAHDALGSNVSYAVKDVHTLDPASDGTFDLVLFINVLYHLKNPMLALERLASVTRMGGTLVLKTYYRSDLRFWFRGRCVSLDLDRRPKWWFFPTTELGGDPTNWFAPNVAGVEAMLAATGWRLDRELGRFGDRYYCHATRVG